MSELDYNQILKNQDAISKLTLEEVRQLKNDLNVRLLELKTQPPKYHILNDPDNIKIFIENTIDENFIPRTQYVISINREAVQDHKVFWKQYILENNPIPEENYDSYMDKQILGWVQEQMWKSATL